MIGSRTILSQLIGKALTPMYADDVREGATDRGAVRTGRVGFG